MVNRTLINDLWVVVLVLVISSSSCSSKKSGAISESEYSELFQSFQLSLSSDKKKFASLIESVEVVPLEETEESLLTSASRVIKYDGQYLVVNKGDEEIVFFNKQGKYIRTFNRLGEGPGEYKSINTFWVKEDVISVYERGRSIIFRYTLAGDFIDSRKLPTQVGHVGEYGENYVVEFNFNLIGDSVLYKFGVLDKELKPKDLYLKTDEFDAVAVWSNENSVIPYNDGMLLVRMYCDTIYYYKKGKFEPLIHFDFGEDWYWEAGAILKSADYNLIENSGKAWDVVSRVSDKLIYARAVVAFSHYEHYLIDKLTGKAVRIDLKKNTETEYVPYNLGWEDDRWFISMAPDDLLLLTEALGVDLPNIDQISQSENPALVKVSFKDSAEW